MGEPADETKEEDDTAKESGAADIAAAALARYSEASESLRQRADLAAKVIAGGGSALITAVGLTKFSDLFPTPPDPSNIKWLESWPVVGRVDLLVMHAIGSRVELAMIGVIGGFVLMLGAVGFLAFRYWKVTEPLPMRSDLARMDLKRKKELKLVEDTYEGVATLNDVCSLLAYETKAHSFERIAKWLPMEDANEVRAEAAQIQTEVLATQVQARLRVLRQRVSKAVRGWLSVLAYAIFIFGVLAFGIGSDYLASERTDAIAVAKACADARKVEPKLTLPSICGDAKSEDESDLETPTQIATARRQLASELEDCYTDVETNDSLDASACNKLLDAIASLKF